jgi:hypothetical protein
MATNYASILAEKYHSHKDTSMQGEVELAFVVVDILSSDTEVTGSWLSLLKSARGLVKTRAKRSRTKFRMQFKKALESSDLTPLAELPGVDLPKDRDERFKLRILNPQFMTRRVTPAIIKPVIAPDVETVIISQDEPGLKEREDEFNRRLTYPRSFRRRN